MINRGFSSCWLHDPLEYKLHEGRHFHLFPAVCISGSRECPNLALKSRCSLDIYWMNKWQLLTFLQHMLLQSTFMPLFQEKHALALWPKLWWMREIWARPLHTLQASKSASKRKNNYNQVMSIPIRNVESKRESHSRDPKQGQRR